MPRNGASAERTPSWGGPVVVERAETFAAPWPGNRPTEVAPGEAKLHVTHRGLFIHGERVAKHRDVAFGRMDEGDPPTLTLVSRYGHAFLRVRLQDRSDGEAILRALRLDRPDVIRLWSLPSRWTRWALTAGLCALGLVPFVVDSSYVVIPATFAIMIWSGAMMFSGLPGFSRLTLGRDGLFIRRGLRSRFVPVAKVVSLGVREGVLVAELLDGEVVPLMHEVSRDRRDLERVAEHLRQWMAERVPTARSLEASLSALASVSEGALPAEGYRASAPPIDVLREVVLDPGADPRARAVAARALSDHGEQHRRELRELAGTTAAPKLRVAFERAADGDGPGVEQALAELASAAQVRDGAP